MAGVILRFFVIFFFMFIIRNCHSHLFGNTVEIFPYPLEKGKHQHFPFFQITIVKLLRIWCRWNWFYSQLINF